MQIELSMIMHELWEYYHKIRIQIHADERCRCSHMCIDDFNKELHGSHAHRSTQRSMLSMYKLWKVKKLWVFTHVSHLFFKKTFYTAHWLISPELKQAVLDCLIRWASRHIRDINTSTYQFSTILLCTWLQRCGCHNRNTFQY